MKQYRNTIQREIVLEAINDLTGKHPTPDEIFKYVSEKYPNISRSTVYRNINILSDQGKVLKISVPNTAERIDSNINSHYHIYCEKCGKVFDIDIPYFDNIEDKIIDKKGFKILSHDIVFTGICPKCNK